MPSTPPLLPGGAGAAATSSIGPAPADGTGSSGTKPPGSEPPESDRDRLCPDPEREPGGFSDNQAESKAYQEYVGRLVNPGEPTVPAGWAYRFVDPQTGKAVFIDHCRLSDGAFIDAKGKYAFLLSIEGKSDEVAKKFLNQARLQLHLAEAYGGRPVEFWFKETIMADFVRDAFAKAGDLNGRVIARHVPFER